MKIQTALCFLILGLTSAAQARIFQVATNGDDSNPGTRKAPFRTIQRAAAAAQPGDVITVRQGVYRERVDPPRGGDSAARRIVYQAAPGERVVITGSEPIQGWRKVGPGDTWKVTIPNSFFGSFNPYADLIHGDWFDPLGRPHHTGSVYLNGDWLMEAATLDEVLKPAGPTPLWFAIVEGGEKSPGTNTTIWAQFKGVNPNEQLVEINARQTVFYPAKTGINFLTVRGFDLRQAATPWAPPTAEQIGLLGTHWSKGWIIESNEISYSKCSGVALGKYGDAWDNRSESAEGYIATIHRALTNGWNKATVGSHLVRGNHIHHCEQTGIVGSLGCSFSVITGNVIHDIHVRRLFSGAEMAGIKFHGAIDVQISHNHIYRAVRGIWLDWMAQGAQVTGNLLHDNLDQDVFCEMQHGPLLLANNLFLTPKQSLWFNSKGIAVAHNLIAGPLSSTPYDGRNTPFHLAHSTEIAGLHDAPSGDHRFYNNLFVAPGSDRELDHSRLECWAGGNVFTKGAPPSKFDQEALLEPDFDPGLALAEKADGWYLELALDGAWAAKQPRRLVTTKLLGHAKIPGLPYENPDGSPLRLDTDYFGRPRDPKNPFPGPFEVTTSGKRTLKVFAPPGN
jgi:alpha-N-arabinofuranosidase